MAVQIETQGQLAEFLEILSRRRWQLLLPALFLFALGVSLAVFIPKKYLVATQIEVRVVSVSSSGKEAENAPNQIRAVERIRKVLETQRRPAYLALGPRERTDFVKDVRDDLKVRTEKAPGATSSFVTIEYTHADVHLAMEFLKAVRDDWRKDVLDRERNRAESDAARASEDVDALEKEHVKEEQALSRLYKDNRISATQPIPGGKDQRNEDPDFEALQKAKDMLAQCEFDLVRAERVVANLEQRLADTPPTQSEEQLLEGVNTSADIIAIEKQILEQNAELARYRPTHTKYELILQEIEKLENKRDAIKRLATRTELASVARANPVYADLQQKLEDARLDRDTRADEKLALEKVIKSNVKSVEQLYPVIYEIRQHSARAERLSKELEAATLKRDDKVALARALASQLNDPFSITQEVQEPLKPTEPNPWLIVAFALVAGSALGLALALSAEYGRNCFRSVHDISRVMVAPVLGNVGTIRTTRQMRARSLRRLVVGLASAGLLFLVAFVTWAWSRNPELLSPQLRARIEQLRDKLR
jgi:capsular polysaccharide biosynthesis protein